MHALGELISSLGELIGQLIENLIGAISALLQALGVEERVADPLSGLLIVGSIVLGLGGTYFYVVNTPKFAVERVCSSLITRNRMLLQSESTGTPAWSAW